jgi:uncharacterized membrane protein YraQ (UPF0718 family)
MLKVCWNFIITKINSIWAAETAAALVPANVTLLTESQIATWTASTCENTANCQEQNQWNPSPTSTRDVERSSKSLFWRRLAGETWSAAIMVTKFMLLAWFLGALIRLYIPESWITSILGSANPWSIVTAALLGIPVYTSSLAAMPLVGGLLAQGMHPAAALAFLIAGPTTTLPAMSAVWGLVNRRVFYLYISISLASAILAGFIYQFFL